MLTAKNHQSNQVACHPGHPELHRGVPAEWYERDTERREDDAHRDVRDVLRVHRAALEPERAIVAREEAGEADDDLAERGVDVEVELALDVVGAELAKVRLVPDDDVGLADVVEARPAREESVHDGRDVLEVLQEELALYFLFPPREKREGVRPTPGHY